MKDLFENPELLPIEVLEILEKYSDSENDYQTCFELVQELNSLGYTCDFDLAGEFFNLRKI